jgi:hypothetical protein
MSWGVETIIQNVKKGNVPYFMVLVMLTTMALSITTAIYTGNIYRGVYNTEISAVLSKKGSNPPVNDPTAQSVYNMCSVIIAFSSILAVGMFIAFFAILGNSDAMFNANRYFAFFIFVGVCSAIMFITSLVLTNYMDDLAKVDPDKINAGTINDFKGYVRMMWILSLSLLVMSVVLGIILYITTRHKEAAEKEEKRKQKLIDENSELKNLDTIIKGASYQMKVLEKQISDEDDDLVKIKLNNKLDKLKDDLKRSEANFDEMYKKIKSGGAEGGEEDVQEQLKRQLEESEKRAKEQQRLKDLEDLKRKQAEIEKLEKEKREEAEHQKKMKEMTSSMEDRLKKLSASTEQTAPGPLPTASTVSSQPAKPSNIIETDLSTLEQLSKKAVSTVLTPQEVSEYASIYEDLRKVFERSHDLRNKYGSKLSGYGSEFGLIKSRSDKAHRSSEFSGNVPKLDDIPSVPVSQIPSGSGRTNVTLDLVQEYVDHPIPKPGSGATIDDWKKYETQQQALKSWTDSHGSLPFTSDQKALAQNLAQSQPVRVSPSIQQKPLHTAFEQPQ